MSTVRINAASGGPDMPARAGASHRGAEDASPADAFAAALGAATPNSQRAHEHLPTGPDDGSSSDDHAGGKSGHLKPAATMVGDTAEANADNEKTAIVAPAVSAWFTPPGAPSPGRQRGPSAPTAAEAALTAAAIAAALIAPAGQPPAAPGPAGEKSAAGTPPIARPEGLSAGVSAQAGPNPQSLVSGLPAPDGPAGPIGGSGVEPMPEKPRAASIDAASAPSPGQVAAWAPPAGLPAGPASDPSIPVAHLSGPPLAHAAAGAPAQTTQFDTAALSASMPGAGVSAMTNPASTGGYDSRGPSDRNDRAAETAALGGIGATTGTDADSAAGVSAGLAAGSSGPAGGPDPGAAGVANQLSGQVIRLLANAGHEALVRLHPPDLGEVTVRVAVSGRDVSAWFSASQPDVQQTISLGLGQLQTDLGNAGYNLGGAWVGADTSGFGAGGGAGQQPPPPPSAIAAAQPAPIGPAAALSSNSGVSIYV